MDRVPEFNFRQIGIPVVMIWAVIAVGLECWWRHEAHRPTVVDDKLYWSLIRRQVNDDRSTVALLGRSRMKQNFSLEEFNQLRPANAVFQLAIDGAYPVAALRDLAYETDFKGVVLCGIVAPALSRSRWNDQEPYVTHHASAYAIQLLEPWLAGRVQHCFAVLNPSISLKQCLYQFLQKRRLPEPRHVVMGVDRSGYADFSQQDRESRQRQMVASARRSYDTWLEQDADRWVEDVAVVQQMVQAIQSRGGQVVFVRMPTIGEHWKLDEQIFPRGDYWDRLGDLTTARCIHFRDVPGMASLDCPDSSHLDQRDKAVFTRLLVEELQRRQVLSDER